MIHFSLVGFLKQQECTTVSNKDPVLVSCRVREGILVIPDRVTSPNRKYPSRNTILNPISLNPHLELLNAINHHPKLKP